MKHKVQEIAPNTWCLKEYGVVQAFLVVGNEYAALLDTGDGMGDLRSEVKEITEKPLYVLNTHGHLDHAGGNSQFPVVYLSPNDFEASEAMCTYAMRKWYVDTRIGRFCPEYLMEAQESLIPDRPYARVGIREGMVVTLGGRNLEVIETPGHTVGSLCFLDRKEHLLFTGDMANDGTIVHKKNQFYGSTVETYHRSMKKLWNLDGYDYVVRCHGEALKTKDQIKKLIGLTGKILDGTLTGIRDTQGIRDGVCYRLEEEYPGMDFWCDGDNIFDNDRRKN